jgi:4-cresol dehydrogenase (hydroxylating)
MTTRDIAAFRRVIEPIFREYQFELCITLAAVNPGCFETTIPLLYDRDNLDEVGRAETCHATLLRACKAATYFPYRRGIQSMLEEISAADTFWKIVQRLKIALEPKRHSCASGEHPSL